MPELLAVPVVSGPRVTLRPHTMADLEAVLERCVDPVTQAFTTIPLEYTRTDAEAYLSGLLKPSTEVISWAIETDGRYAGTLDLRAMAIDEGAGNIGFVTHPALRGRGVMTEAVGLMLGHAFDTLGWQFVRWQAHADNWASARAVWRNGFPAPTYVPALLVERGRIVDGCMSTLWRDAPRRSLGPWEEWSRALRPPAPHPGPAQEGAPAPQA